MRKVLDSALVIARRDFVATVWSKTFLLFLIAPLLVGVFSGAIGVVTSKADIDARQPVVAVIAAPDVAAALKASHDRLITAMGEHSLPDLKAVEPSGDIAAQTKRLLADKESNTSAVFTGTLDRPALTGPKSALKSVGKEMTLIVNEARNAGALEAAGVDVAPVKVRTTAAQTSAGSLNLVRHGLARGGQALIFFLTLMLATMLLSNMVEEKSNKVIEVLAAAVPLDAIFFGKLLAMLGASMVGIVFWGILAGVGLLFLQGLTSITVAPAVGWPLYCLMIMIYFAANYMLLGAVFLGIGAQASNVREVQTLSMPITFGQLAIFAFASAAVGDNGGLITWLAAIFPLSSPLAMIGFGAQSALLWPHLLAIIWQALWVWIFIKIGARLFRKTVLKSGPAGFAALLRPKRA